MKEFIRRLLGAAGYELRKINSPLGIKAQRRLFPEAKMILDVGANEGSVAKTYASIFAGATIHAFEPFPETFSRLVKNVASISAIHPHCLAIANEDGERTFHVTKCDLMNSLLELNEEGTSFVRGAVKDGTTIVKTVALDNWVKRNGIERIDILKVDAQGAEPLIFAGAKSLLESRAIRIIYCEVMFTKQYEQQANFDDLWHLLGSYGYRLQNLYHQSLGSGHLLAYCDAVFLASDFQVPVGIELY